MAHQLVTAMSSTAAKQDLSSADWGKRTADATPSRKGSMMSMLTPESDSFVESMLATHTQDCLDCLLNPESHKELLALKRQYGIPSFDAVVSDESTLEPWTAFVFLEFMQSEFNDEAFYFYQEVEALKHAQGQAVKRPREVLLCLPETARVNLVSWVSEIKKEFIDEGSRREINISAGQRARLCSALDYAIASKEIPLEVFSEAQLEVKNLMARDAWPRFALYLSTVNINHRERIARLTLSFVLLILNIGIIAIMFWQEVPRYLALISFFPWFQIVDGFVVAKTNVCSVRGFLGIRMLRNAVFFSKGQPAVACPFIKRSMRRAAQRQLKRIILLAALLSCLTFGLTYVMW